MRYLEINTGPSLNEAELPWRAKLLQRVFPAANPDLEPLLSATVVWWLEIDDNGEPVREIGFDVRGEAVILGPVEGNSGFLIDSSDDWSGSNNDSPKAAIEFDRTWNSLWPKFEKLDRRNRFK